MHDALGVFSGFGYAALIALVAARLGSRRGPVVTALSAVGQRSMTCYLSQSVVWTPVFTPGLLGLASELSVAGTALLAVATWVVTIGVAEALRRTHRRGRSRCWSGVSRTDGRGPPRRDGADEADGADCRQRDLGAQLVRSRMRSDQMVSIVSSAAARSRW